MTAKDLLLVVIIPLILTEVGPWCGWLAARLLTWAAKLRYGNTERAAVRLQEWSGDLDDIPGQLTKLAYAIGQFTAGSVAFARRKAKRPLRKAQLEGLNRSAELANSDLHAPFPYMNRERWAQFWETVEEAAARRGLPPEAPPRYPADEMAAKLRSTNCR